MHQLPPPPLTSPPTVVTGGAAIPCAPERFLLLSALRWLFFCFFCDVKHEKKKKTINPSAVLLIHDYSYFKKHTYAAFILYRDRNMGIPRNTVPGVFLLVLTDKAIGNGARFFYYY